MITLGFTLAVTFMVSEDKNALSKLQSVLQVGTTMMSHERVRCKGGRCIELTPRVYVFSCILNDLPSVDWLVGWLFWA